MAVIALIAVVVGVVAGRASGASDGGGGAGGAASGKKVDVVIKASDSSLWQTMLAGSAKAAKDYGLKVGLFGPTSQTDGRRVPVDDPALLLALDERAGRCRRRRQSTSPHHQRRREHEPLERRSLRAVFGRYIYAVGRTPSRRGWRACR